MLALAFRITTQWREKGQGLPHGLFFFFFKQEKDLHVLYVLGASLFILCFKQLYKPLFMEGIMYIHFR